MDFGKWMAQSTRALAEASRATAKDAAKEKHASELIEHDVVRDVEGGYVALCCKCDRWTELYCDVMDIDVNYEHYCGGSPYCCP
jgi:hypothetical protein